MIRRLKAVNVNTVAATEFWPSPSCQLKKKYVVHALLSLHMSKNLSLSMLHSNT
jgi:hypothetical protein